MGSHNVLTGWNDQTVQGRSRYPDLGSVISRMRSGVEDAEVALGASTDPRLARGMKGSRRATGPTRSELPQYVDIGGGLHRGGPAFLGPVYSAFPVAGDPSKPGFVVQNVQVGAAGGRLHDRLEMLSDLDRLGLGIDPQAAVF
ncbi:MAG: hypothetical protein ACKOJF_16675, partial [Planctomycetaceae bacterium]